MQTIHLSLGHKEILLCNQEFSCVVYARIKLYNNLIREDELIRNRSICNTLTDTETAVNIQT